VAGFLLHGSVPEPFTLFESIRALPAGHWMEVTASGPSEPRPFFSVARVWFDAARERLAMPAAERQAAIAGAVRDSVRAHLVSDVPIGAFLSAGRDSGSVVALARESGTPLQTLTLRFDEHEGTRHDEAPVAAIVARQYGTAHTTVTLCAEEFRDELPRILTAMDQPSVDALNSWFVCAAAGRLGWKVALSGTGGDELFGGYSTFRTIPHTVRTFGVFRHLPRLARAYGRLYRAIVPRTPRFSPKSSALPQYACTWEGAYLVKRGLFLPEELPAILGEETAREALRRLDPLRRIRDVLTPDPGHPYARVAALESELFLRNQLLRDLDWCSMAHGLEVRVPLVDHLLLQRLAPLVIEGGGKDLLTRAPRQPLPPEVLQRPKTGFTIPARQWLDNRPSRVNIHPFGRRNWALFLLDAM
jgi:asparagine synthase (glutamine-hydrolysing)